jgi:hypothetical protein
VLALSSTARRQREAARRTPQAAPAEGRAASGAYAVGDHDDLGEDDGGAVALQLAHPRLERPGIDEARGGSAFDPKPLLRAWDVWS